MTQNIHMAEEGTSEMFKAAGAQQALADLGLVGSLGMEKDAFLTKLVTVPLSLAAKGLGWGVGKAGQGVWGALKGTTGAIGDTVGRAGTGLVQGASKGLGLPQGATDFALKAGKGVGRDIVGLGLLGGVTEAAIADPGQRWDAFKRGLGYGAIGGVGWGLGSNLTRMGLSRGFKALGSGASGLGKGQAGLGLFKSTDPFAAMQQTAKPGIMKGTFGAGRSGGERARIFGTRLLTGGVPLAGAFYASDLVTPGHTGGAPRPFYQQPQMYYPLMASAIGGGRPGGYPGYGGY